MEGKFGEPNRRESRKQSLKAGLLKRESKGEVNGVKICSISSVVTVCTALCD
jgi:hypothetical protein